MSWSEMVTDDASNIATDLPVIDFADLGADVINAKTPRAPVFRRAPKSKRPPANRRSSAPAAPPAPSEPPSEPAAAATAAPSGQTISDDEPKPPSVSAPHRRGQTARQAYQERLESDPSYVPTVGEFWGHDDRLLDKDLRSLSGWWRGRWQGGARGRGFGVRGHGRGRGRGGAHTTNDGHSNGEIPTSSPTDLPPVDRPWTHDGFEELKRREEQRSQRQDQTQGSSSNSRGVRGGFGPRGRGFGRGRFSPRPGITPSTDSPTSPRTWFLIKPERPWTKHHELFLYSDPSHRPRTNQGPTYRVKLPGASSAAVVQSSSQPSPPRAPTPPREDAHEDSEIVFVVSLPRGQHRPDIAESTPTTIAAPPSPAPAPTSPLQEVSEVAPAQVLAPPSLSITSAITSPPKLHVVIEEQPVPTSEAPSDDPFKLREPPPPTVIPLPSSTPTQINPAASTPSAAVSPSAPAPISQSATAPEGGLLWRSPPPHLQTTFAQPPPAAPGYASPYTYAPVPAPTMTPGVALDPNGMPYDLATGRPLYMAAPAQVPTPVYMMPYPQMHPQMQHRSHASPDPSLFAPARQSSRIEIRRPDGSSASDEARLLSHFHASRASTLRASASAPAFVPSQTQVPPPSAPHEFYPSPPPEVTPAPAPTAVMGYPYAQPPYYAYAAPEGYAYPPPQFVDYEAYAADPRGGAPTAAVYYS
ncbi:hypothetical protein EI94DRAFT_1811419 [Lactarius quietus]|nr:hypothetical protein EI94DRAFT_1811419 [Lactarius quietus]